MTNKYELNVIMLNINVGYNQQLMEQCKTLRDYALYVDKIRTYAKSMSPEEAVKCAVDECIQNDILKEFLLKQKAEAIKVTIYEFDQVKHDEALREEGLEAGREEGRESSIIGIIRYQLIQKRTPADTAHLLGLDEDYVFKIADLLFQFPNEDDLEIARRFLYDK